MENENINLNRHKDLQYLFRCNKGVALGCQFATFTDHTRQRLLYVGMELRKVAGDATRRGNS